MDLVWNTTMIDAAMKIAKERFMMNCVAGHMIRLCNWYKFSFTNQVFLLPADPAGGVLHLKLRYAHGPIWCATVGRLPYHSKPLPR
jgi:hypothetical protein